MGPWSRAAVMSQFFNELYETAKFLLIEGRKVKILFTIKVMSVKKRRVAEKIENKIKITHINLEI